MRNGRGEADLRAQRRDHEGPGVEHGAYNSSRTKWQTTRRAAILYHGLRLLLEVHPDFLVVRIDLRNAYNESRRAQVLQRMAAVPGVASLVPLILHAMYGPAGIIVLPDGSRLFAGSDRGDFEEGLPQGSPESSLAFCVLIQEAVQELQEALAGGGGAVMPAEWRRRSARESSPYR